MFSSVAASEGASPAVTVVSEVHRSSSAPPFNREGMATFLMNRYSILDTNLAEAMRGLQSHDARLDDLFERQERHEAGFFIALRTTHQNVQGLQQAMDNDITDLDNQIRSVEGQTVVQGEDIVNIQRDILYIQDRIQDAEITEESQGAQMTVLKDKLEDVEAQNRQMEAEIATLNRKLEEQNKAFSDNMNIFMARLNALEEDRPSKRARVEAAASSSSSFMDTMALVQTNQIMKLREEVAAIKEKSNEGKDLVEHNMATIAKRAERSAELVNVLVQRANEAAEIINGLDENSMTGLSDDLSRLARQVQTGFSELSDHVDERIRKLNQQVLIHQKQSHLLYWSVLEQHELNRGVPSEVLTPGLFGGLAPNHEQYLLFVARREIKQVLLELTSLNAVPTIFPGFTPLPLTARPLVHRI